MTITLNGTSGIVNDATDLNYTGTLTGGTGVVNLGSGQVYKDASGNVGIGTSSPAAKLDISSGGGTKARITSTIDNNADLDFYTNGVQRGLIEGNSVGMLFGTTGALPNIFITNNTERARIDSSGNLLVGTTSASNTKLRVVTPSSTDGCVVELAGNGGTNLGANRTGASGSQFVLYNIYNGSYVGGISMTSTGTSFNTSSDYRLKDTIAPMVGALSTVAALKPCTYKWKVDGSDGQGFIAHELAEVVPDCVTGEKDAVTLQQVEVSPAVPATFDADGNELTPAIEAVFEEREVPQYQGIDTSFLVATLAAAIQELKAIVDAQGAEIAALKGTP